jgi:hypothetical protein
LEARGGELRWCGIFIAALVLIAVPLGVLWDLLSPPGPLAARLPGGIEVEESRAWIEADGRFAAIVFLVGVVAGVVAWLLRPARGVVMAAALTAGTLLNAYLIELVGRLVRGSGPVVGHGQGFVLQGKQVQCSQLACYPHLSLGVHMSGLLLTGSAVALLIYGACVGFAARDDLGRPELPSLDTP